MRKAILLIAVLCIMGCATTQIETLSNPNYRSTIMKRILVSVPFQDLALRKYSESSFKQQLELNSFIVYMSIDVLPPIKQYTKEDLISVITKYNIQALLEITLTDFYTKQSYVPQSSYTTGSAHVYGNTVYGRSQTNTYGGYYISKPRVRFEANLFESNTGEIAWKATSFTAGNAFAGNEVLIDSLSSEIAARMGTEIRH